MLFTLREVTAVTWIDSIRAAQPKYEKGFTDQTIRKRLWLSMLKRRGGFTFNESGDHCVNRLKYSLPKSEGYEDGAALDFTNHQSLDEIKLPWRGMVAKDTMTLMQFAMNNGEQQTINHFQLKSNNVMEGLQRDFGATLLRTDGYAAANLTLPMGLETVLGNDGATVAADKIARPSDSYGITSVSTTPGTYGDWSADLSTPPNATIAKDWPDGYGDPEFEYLAPILLNYSSTSWGTGQTDWETNCWRVISQGITWTTIRDYTPDIVLLSGWMFQRYKEHHEAKMRINIPHKEAQDLGFSVNVVNQDGVAIHHDPDVTANVGYILPLKTIEVASLMPTLFKLLHGYDQVGGKLAGFLQAMDIRTLSQLIVAVYYGNTRFNPRALGRIAAYA